MSPRKKNSPPAGILGHPGGLRSFLPGRGSLLAALALFLALASPSMRAPTSVILTGNGEPGSEIRQFSMLASGAERILSPGNQPAAWPGYPRVNRAPADTPGPIASLIAAPAVALGEPVLAWNMAAVLIPWLTFISMFLLCRICTGNPIAAGIAGLGYALPPAVLLDPTSTFLLLSPLLPATVLATGWVVREKAGPAFFVLAGLTLPLALAPLPIAVSAIVVSALLVLHQRPHERSTLGRLSACLTLLIALRAAFGPALVLPGTLVYPSLEADELWAFMPGGLAGPGLIIACLAAVGIMDRTRGAYKGRLGDPRLLIFVALLVLPLALADEISIGDGLRQELPGSWLEGRAPEANSLRWSLRLLLPFGWCLLAAFGSLAILERVHSPITQRIWGAIFFTGLILGNLLYPLNPISIAPAQARRVSFLSPPLEEAQLLQQVQPGAILDLPTGIPDRAAHRHLTAAWHRRATTTGSIDGRDPAKPLASFAAELAQPAGAEALATLGFGNILIHKHDLSAEAYEQFLRNLARSRGAGGRLTTRAESSGHLLLGLQGNFPVAENFDVLESNQPSTTTLNLTGPEDLLVFELQVRGQSNFRHPAPETETPLRVEFFDFRGRLVAEHLLVGFLPVAVARGGNGHTALRLALPEAPGRYTARLALQSDPSLTLAIQSIRVAPAP